MNSWKPSPYTLLEAHQAQAPLRALGWAAEHELRVDGSEVADVAQPEPIGRRLRHDDRVRILGGGRRQRDHTCMA